jgi:hypothetical protein
VSAGSAILPLFIGPALAVFAMAGPFQRILLEVFEEFRANLALRRVLRFQLLLMISGTVT